MLGQSLLSGRTNSPADDRVFVYEVTGLKQSQANDNNDYSFRSSSSVFVSVPYQRMNESMQRIGKMGGTIVKIQSLTDFKQQGESNPEPENSQENDTPQRKKSK